MDCSPPGSSVHGIFQARLLELVAIFFSGGTFLTQGSNSGCPHCKQIPHCQSHQRPWGKWAMKWGLAPPPNAEDSGKLTWTTQASPSAQTPWKWSGVWVLLFSVVPQCKHWRLSSFFFIIFIFGCTGSSLICTGFFLAVVSRGYSLAVMHGLLIVVASLAVEHGPWVGGLQ